ncbi:transposase [Streptomyces sp. NPDC004520]|uniref:transposase n=1 Tax=Streptomyces sp. NPDC004520 TaxID=3364702 RepID=UPI0036867740
MIPGVPRDAGKKYPAIVRLRENAWGEFVLFLRFDIGTRRVVCTANAIESVNAHTGQGR